MPTAETCKSGAIDRDLHLASRSATGLPSAAATPGALASLHRLLAAVSAFCDTFYDARGVCVLCVCVRAGSFRVALACVCLRVITSLQQTVVLLL